MELAIAIEELYSTGWVAERPASCSLDSAGRPYPSIEEVQRLFRGQGFDLEIKRVELFDCYRAEWSGAEGEDAGAVVGQSSVAAAVHALATLRRQFAVSVA